MSQSLINDDDGEDDDTERKCYQCTRPESELPRYLNGYTVTGIPRYRSALNYVDYKGKNILGLPHLTNELKSKVMELKLEVKKLGLPALRCCLPWHSFHDGHGSETGFCMTCPARLRPARWPGAASPCSTTTWPKLRPTWCWPWSTWAWSPTWRRKR